MLLGVAVTGWLSRWHDQQNGKFAESAFLRQSDQLADLLRERINGYGHDLRGLRGLFIVKLNSG